MSYRKRHVGGVISWGRHDRKSKVVIRFLTTEGRGGGSWFLLLLKFQYCPKYDF